MQSEIDRYLLLNRLELDRRRRPQPQTRDVMIEVLGVVKGRYLIRFPGGDPFVAGVAGNTGVIPAGQMVKGAIVGDNVVLECSPRVAPKQAEESPIIPEIGGFLVLGSINWLQTFRRDFRTGPLISNPRPLANYEFFDRILRKLSKDQKIYTLAQTDPRIADDEENFQINRRYSLFPESGNFVSGIGVAIESIAANNIEVVPINLLTEAARVRGLFYLPMLFNYGVPLQEEEIAALKSIARRNIVILQGLALFDYDRVFSVVEPQLLRLLGIRRVSSFLSFVHSSELIPQNNSLSAGLKPVDDSIYGSFPVSQVFLNVDRRDVVMGLNGVSGDLGGDSIVLLRPGRYF